MHLTLLLPGLLLPTEVARALADPLRQCALDAVLSRAEVIETTERPQPPHLAWLGEHVFRQAMPLATAPYAYAALAGEPPPTDEVIWHADPVHLELARDHLMVTPLAASPAASDALALTDSANALAASHEATLAVVGGQWFLRTRRRWDLQPAPLSAVLGEPLFGVLPGGADAVTWHRLLNEIQMAWHVHPVNEAREARGESTVNSVWLHGGGAWSALPPMPFARVLTDEPELRGAAQAAGADWSEAAATPVDRALMVWSDALAARQLGDWSGWVDAVKAIDARLAAFARSCDLTLVLTGERRLRVVRARPVDRLKFWRHATAEEVLSE